MLIFVASFLTRNVIKTKHRKSIMVAGKLLQVAYIMMLVALKEDSKNWVIVIGALRGLSGGMYYNVHNIWEGEAISETKRDSFIGMYKSVSGCINIFVPIISGYLIKIYGYTSAFMAIILLTAIHIIACICYKDTIQISSDSTNIIKAWKTMLKHKQLRQYISAVLFHGYTWSDGALCTLLILYTARLYSGSEKLGTITTITYIFAITFGALYAKYIKHSRKLTAALSLILCIITVAAYFGMVEVSTGVFILLFTFSSKMHRVIEDVEYNIAYYNVAATDGIKENRVEYTVLIELALFISRCAGYIMLIVGVAYDITIVLLLYAIAMLAKTVILNKTYIDFGKSINKNISGTA